MKSKHGMLFGAECLAGGGVRFRLWAPGAKRIDLVLADSVNGMNGVGDGWFELVTDGASAGSRYRFQVDGGTLVPDPASRLQPEDVNGPSEVVDPCAFEWTDGGWRGRPWEEAVIYELHVGAFSPSGTFAGVEERLQYLMGLGVTAVELMPVADFFGRRNWGYDGVLPFAPDSAYGSPDDLKRLIQAAHGLGLMVFLDVVYNHFGPEGNYLRAYAPQFFTSRHTTPWGDGINFDGEQSPVVREFFVHNALYWLEEFHFDGLRLDAVHAIQDNSSPDILTELAETVHRTIGRGRQVHLMLENDDNAARYLRPSLYRAQWNDDFHHAAHVLVSGETGGYYLDYDHQPLGALARCLTEGFYYQGEPSLFRDGKLRGEVSKGLPPASFISFLQNHDQIGNRAFGERLTALASPEALRAMTAIFLLAPSPPLLFMGEEYGALTPFLFFCDFRSDLAKAVTEGRRAEFAKFPEFGDEQSRNSIPDPNSEGTFLSSKLAWSCLLRPVHAEWLQFYSNLLALRQKKIVAFVQERASDSAACFAVIEDAGLKVEWESGDRRLTLLANLSGRNLPIVPPGDESLVYATPAPFRDGQMSAWSAAWYLSA